MKLKHVMLHACAVVSLLCSSVAHAALYQFDLTGAYAASWQLDSSVRPNEVRDGISFTIWDTPGFPDTLFGVADVIFYHDDVGGGLAILDFYNGVALAVADGPQLYTGPERDPVFTLGTFALTEYRGNGNYRLRISEVGAVPEPETYAMLVAGLGLMGVALRRRR
ncbi:MAG: PEP-CTERM sorting domain-containing protein [Duganella sp.]